MKPKVDVAAFKLLIETLLKLEVPELILSNGPFIVVVPLFITLPLLITVPMLVVVPVLVVLALFITIPLIVVVPFNVVGPEIVVLEKVAEEVAVILPVVTFPNVARAANKF